MKAILNDAVLKQCIYELNQWGRLLAFLKEENAFYKSRLSEVVPDIEDEYSLLAAEEFNEQFLLQDNMIDFLSEELKKHDRLLQKDFYIDGASIKGIIKSQRVLSRNFQNAEILFSRTKKSFSVYLLSLL